ncbi:MAG: OmpH family outer membrane protein [Bacteroidales bacterium]
MNKLNKLSPILNIVLLVAVALLFYLHFQGDGKILDSGEKSEKAEVSEEEFTDYNQLRVAYVNLDSLLEDYDLYIDKREEFEKEQNQSMSELQTRSQQLRQEYQEMQEKLDKGLMTRSRAQIAQQELGQKEQELYQQRDQVTSELSEQEQVIYRQVLNSIQDYLEEYARENDFHYVLSYSFGGPILYKARQFNVTRDVLKGLNEEYAKEND